MFAFELLRHVVPLAMGSLTSVDGLLALCLLVGMALREQRTGIAAASAAVLVLISVSP